MNDTAQAQSAGFNVIRFITWIIYVILAFAVIVLAFAFALLLFGADPSAGFANFIYESAARFIDPFRGMIEPTELGNGGLISWSSLFAMAACFTWERTARNDISTGFPAAMIALTHGSI